MIDPNLFQQLWDQIKAQPDVVEIRIIAVLGEKLKEGESRTVRAISKSDDPIEQLRETLDYLEGNAPVKKRGRKPK